MIEHLPWDSNFLCLEVGGFSASKIETIEKSLEIAKSKHYKLIYLFATADCFLADDFLQKYNGKLVDRKVLYSMELADQTIEHYEQTISYTKTEVTDDLLKLTYECGTFSRFRLDTNFAPEVFTRMYQQWIENSVKGLIADRVYVVKRENETVALVTLKAKNETLQIGLLATAVDAQGKGYGKQLINRTKQTAIDLGLKNIEVPTQYVNKQACRFYETCGFKVKCITNIYHFWL